MLVVAGPVANGQKKSTYLEAAVGILVGVGMQVTVPEDLNNLRVPASDSSNHLSRRIGSVDLASAVTHLRTSTAERDRSPHNLPISSFVVRETTFNANFSFSLNSISVVRCLER